MNFWCEVSEWGPGQFVFLIQDVKDACSFSLNKVCRKKHLIIKMFQLSVDIDKVW